MKTAGGAHLALLLGAMLAMAGAVQGTSFAHAAVSHQISGEESCLALPAKARWDPAPGRCTLLGEMTVLAGDMLTVGQGVTFSVDAKARLASAGTITNSANATFAVAGKMTVNAGATLVNSGAFSNAGTFANSGVFVNSADATFKNTGRMTNAGTLTNSAGASLANSGRITNNAIISNQGHVENRGTLAVSEQAVLLASNNIAGATIKNSGKVLAYCGAHITAGAISGRPATDRCDDPPEAAMGQWSPFSPLQSDGQAGTVFTFRANATDDIKLAKLEWDFDGDGRVDYARSLSGRSIMTTATHVYGEQGVYYPQVRAVDSAGARSAWDRYTSAGLDASPANAAPMAASVLMSIVQDMPLAFILEAEDLDGDSLTFSIVSLPEHGILLGDAPDLSYVPDEGYFGQDSFTFTASDGKGESKPARVSIIVGKAEEPMQEAAGVGAFQSAQDAQEQEEGEKLSNTQPVAQSQSVSTSEEVPAPVRLAATDADGDWLEFQIMSDPRYGMLSGKAPDLTYTPDAEFYGQDSFAFMASDSFGGSSTATVTVTVTPVNDMPVAYDDSSSTAQSIPVSIDVLANDEDVEVEFLTIASVSDPQNGSASAGNGLVTYSPDPGFSGADSFTYTVSDGEGGAASATVTVTVAASVPVPQPVPQPAPSAQLYCGRQASSFAHMIEGTEGNDSLMGTKDDDLIIGYGGNDVLRGKAGNDCIVGGQGDDKIYGDKGQDVMEGGDGDDSMWGGADDDSMWGGAGSDRVIGDGGKDLLYGDGGDDSMWGGADDDTLFAGLGNDKLVGDSGSDVLSGEAGDDKIYDDLGDDTIDGGDGYDGCWDVVGSNRITNCESH